MGKAEPVAEWIAKSFAPEVRRELAQMHARVAELEALNAQSADSGAEVTDAECATFQAARREALRHGDLAATRAGLQAFLSARRALAATAPELDVAAAQAECEACGYPAPDANAMAHILAAAQGRRAAPAPEQSVAPQGWTYRDAQRLHDVLVEQTGYHSPFEHEDFLHALRTCERTERLTEPAAVEPQRWRWWSG